jgi:serine/threonine-protein kinase
MDSEDTLDDSTLPGHSRASVIRLPSIDSSGERYREEGVIGRGGMGVVSSYFDNRVGRSVAWKQLRRDIDDDDQGRARFVREARIQGQLEHPAIVPVYDIGASDDGSPYFTMKTVKGVTLADVIGSLAAGDTDKRYARHRLLSAFSRICLAVAYAHERGVVHRDLKPANLILGEYGEVYVLDWGLAKLLGESDVERASRAASVPDATNASTLLGTPGYMAPEQIDNASHVGPAADVYALGTILFELLAYKPLHPRGYAAVDSTQRGVDVRPRLRERDVAPELEAAIVAATALDASARPSPRELSELVERYLEGERDLELRRLRAKTHAQAAEAALRDAWREDERALEARRRAMREINGALVLDPANSSAMGSMIELLSRPPESPPPELVRELERQFRRDIRWISNVGAFVYVAIIGLLGFAWWMGIRDPGPVVVFFALMAVTSGLSMIVARSREPKLALIGAAVVTTAIAFGFATRFASPLVLVPSAVAINATGYAVFLRGRYRALVALASCASFMVPLALELAGVISPTFVFEGGRLVILPMALDLPATPSLVLFAVSSVMAVFLGAVIMGHVRDRLADAESRVFMYAWHLREMVPAEVRARIDPMRITRRETMRGSRVPARRRPLP